jgi:hypothetical protein
MQIPVGSANAARRTAILRPSPKISVPGLIRVASVSVGSAATARITKSSLFVDATTMLRKFGIYELIAVCL